MAIGESYYLTHDIDALNDIKVSALCHEFGFEAYGLFWVCLEHMFPEECLSLPYDDMTFVAIKRQTNTTCDVKAFVDRAIEYGLFERDGEMFYSPSFVKRMAKIDNEADARSEKARKAANARWQKKREQNNGNADAMQSQCSSNANAMPEQCSSNANAMLNDAYEMNRTELNRTNIDSCAKCADRATENDATSICPEDMPQEDAHTSHTSHTSNRSQDIDNSDYITSQNITPDECASEKPPPVVNKKAEQQANNQRFEEFWKAYPRKSDKKRARKIWDRLKVNDELHDKIMRAVSAQTQSDQWRRDGGQFIPYPTTWLNGERWEDSLEHVANTKPREPTPNYDDGEPDFIELLEERRRKEAMNAAQ